MGMNNTSNNHECQIQNIHANPVLAKLVRNPQDWVYSSAGNHAEGQGVFDVKLLWTSFDEDGGWFFGNVDAPALD